MIITDLDGTLLNSENKLSEKNRETLSLLGKKKITRVIATGRVLHSAKQVLDKDFPIDYLIFSSGSGIINFKTGELLKASSINFDDLHTFLKALDKKNLHYMIHAPVPENHFCIFSGNKTLHNEDFKKRLSLYKEYAKPINKKMELPSEWKNRASIIVISCKLKESDQLFNDFEKSFPHLKFIRSTSPLNKDFCWIEVIPSDTSKANASSWLKGYLNISTQTIAIGNDYNDLDLLNWADTGYIVENAPLPLKQMFKVVPSNNNCGFSDAVNYHLKP